MKRAKPSTVTTTVVQEPPQKRPRNDQPIVTDLEGEAEIVVPVLTRINNPPPTVSDPEATNTASNVNININVQQASIENPTPSTFGLSGDLRKRPAPPVDPSDSQANKKQKRGVDEVLADNLLPPPVSGHSLEYFNYETYDSKDPWIQSHWDHDEEHYEDAMGEILPPHLCFGCRNLNPDAITKNSAAIDNTRLAQLVSNMSQAAGKRNINQWCMSLADEYEENIRKPHNKYRKPDQKELPPWPAATIKRHITHHDKNPFFRILKIEDQLDDFADAAYAAAPEIHPIKRRSNGKPLMRVNPDQWKIYKEATQEQHKWLFANVKVMISSRDDMKNYLRSNGSDFVNPAQKNVYYHVNQMTQTKQKQGEGSLRKK